MRNIDVTPTPVSLMGEFPDFKVKDFDINSYNKRFAESNVIIDARAKNISYAPHWGTLSLKCAFNGSEYYQTNNSLYAVDDSCFLLFNEGKIYSSWIDSDIEVESFTVNIAPQFEKESLQSFFSSPTTMLDDPSFMRESPLRFTEKLYHHDEVILPHLNDIRKLSKDCEGNQEEINEKFYFLLEKLLHLQNKTNDEIHAINKFRSGTRIELFDRLTRAKDFIYSSYHRNIELQEIAEVACLNQFYFLRQFKKVFNTTPHQFLTRRRMEVASSKLKQTSKSVSEICAEVGFSDLASFSKLFKRSFGISPLDFRKRNSLRTPIL